jgi:acetyl-CoA carboxylase biotin carboxylase subunit
MSYQPSGGYGVRIDSHIYAGYVIPPFYDSMIAKLIVKASTRIEAIERMKRALKEMKIEGIKTTIPFHLQLMDNEDFRKGNFTTNSWKILRLLQKKYSYLFHFGNPLAYQCNGFFVL